VFASDPKFIGDPTLFLHDASDAPTVHRAPLFLVEAEHVEEETGRDALDAHVSHFVTRIGRKATRFR
jgi:hypothetical protein